MRIRICAVQYFLSIIDLIVYILHVCERLTRLHWWKLLFPRSNCGRMCVDLLLVMRNVFNIGVNASKGMSYIQDTFNSSPSMKTLLIYLYLRVIALKLIRDVMSWLSTKKVIIFEKKTFLIDDETMRLSERRKVYFHLFKFSFRFFLFCYLNANERASEWERERKEEKRKNISYEWKLNSDHETV